MYVIILKGDDYESYYFNKYNCYMFNECIKHYIIENGVIWPYTIKEFLYENMFNENVDDIFEKNGFDDCIEDIF